mmetsp:Transcript_15076/g.46917  ORF Transcript_15076/g.46917 Transcript_15076/m.46917 type:complete len:226 (+) Transcript_15076:189-866(+)
MSVATCPGDMLTNTKPSPSSSRAMHSVAMFIAALVTRYEQAVIWPVPTGTFTVSFSHDPRSLLRLHTSLRPPATLISGRSAWHSSTAPTQLTSRKRIRSALLAASSGSSATPAPALFTSRSTLSTPLPRSSSTKRAIRASSHDTSSCITLHHAPPLPPFSTSARRSSPALEGSRQVATTEQPRESSSAAQPGPIPREQPERKKESTERGKWFRGCARHARSDRRL